MNWVLQDFGDLGFLVGFRSQVRSQYCSGSSHRRENKSHVKRASWVLIAISFRTLSPTKFEELSQYNHTLLNCNAILGRIYMKINIYFLKKPYNWHFSLALTKSILELLESSDEISGPWRYINRIASLQMKTTRDAFHMTYLKTHCVLFQVRKELFPLSCIFWLTLFMW